MKINSIKISYSTTIPIMSYGVNDKIGVEMELTPEIAEATFINDFLEQTIREHKANVDAIVDKLYPSFRGKQVNSVIGTPYAEIQNPTTIPSQKFSPQVPTIEGMKECQTVEELEQKFFRSIDAIKDDEEKKKYFDTYDEVYAKLSNQ